MDRHPRCHHPVGLSRILQLPGRVALFLFTSEHGWCILYSRMENSPMVLKPQDVLVLLKLVSLGRARWSYNGLAADLGMSPSEVHAAVKRAVAARLATPRDDLVAPVTSALKEFLTHGVQYAFVPERGAPTRGMPTAYAAPPLRDELAPSSDLPPVWPDPEGEVRGLAFSPLYKAAPRAARKDPKLYELLVLVDAVRGSGARERALAVRLLEERLQASDAAD